MVVKFLPPNVGEKKCPKVRTSCISVSGRNQHSGGLNNGVGAQGGGGGSSCVARCEQIGTLSSCERVWRTGSTSCYIQKNVHKITNERHVCWTYDDCWNGKFTNFNII